MSWDERRLYSEKWIAEYFTKEKNFHAQCRDPFCQTTVRYAIYSNNFKIHLSDIHQNIHDHEENKDKNDFKWEYFMLTTESAIICILCDISITDFPPYEELSKHANEHIEKRQLIEKSDWRWKYLVEDQVNDFSANCKLCANESVPLYLDVVTVKRHMDTHNKEPKKLTEQWKYLIEKHYFLSKCYTKPANFLTKCRFCKQTYGYFAASFLKDHVKNHKFIYATEVLRCTTMALDNHWPYFRYTKQQRAEKMQIQCIICGQFLLNNQMENHAKTHSPQELSCKFDDWVFKYAKEEEDFLKCTNCNESMYIIVTINHLKTHMSDKHSEDYDRIRRNEMFWTFQTGKNSWLQKCYRDAGNFRAECTVCKFKEVCFKMEQFQRHLRNPIRKSHYNIFNSEEWKQDQQDHNFSNNWKCLRYTYNTERRQIIECVICHQQNVKIDHCCSQDLKSYSQHWVFKYARQNGSYANCTICEENINLDYDWDNLKNHMSSLHLDKWERIEQEEQKIEQIEQKDLEQGTAHDEAGPSTSYAS